MYEKTVKMSVWNKPNELDDIESCSVEDGHMSGHENHGLFLMPFMVRMI